MTSLDELIARAEVTEADFVSARKVVPFDSLKGKRMVRRLEKSKSIIQTLKSAAQAPSCPQMFIMIYNAGNTQLPQNNANALRTYRPTHCTDAGVLDAGTLFRQERYLKSSMISHSVIT